MKTQLLISFVIYTLMTAMSSAAPGPVIKVGDVTGVVVDYEGKSCILILKDFKNWDRKQMGNSRWVTRKKTWKWMESFDKKYAAIFVKKDDLKQIRKGKKIEITGYSYFSDEWAIYPDYKKLTVTE